MRRELSATSGSTYHRIITLMMMILGQYYYVKHYVYLKISFCLTENYYLLVTKVPLKMYT